MTNTNKIKRPPIDKVLQFMSDEKKTVYEMQFHFGICRTLMQEVMREMLRKKLVYFEGGHKEVRKFSVGAKPAYVFCRDTPIAVEDEDLDEEGWPVREPVSTDIRDLVARVPASVFALAAIGG